MGRQHENATCANQPPLSVTKPPPCLRPCPEKWSRSMTCVCGGNTARVQHTRLGAPWRESPVTVVRPMMLRGKLCSARRCATRPACPSYVLWRGGMHFTSSFVKRIGFKREVVLAPILKKFSGTVRCTLSTARRRRGQGRSCLRRACRRGVQSDWTRYTTRCSRMTFS